MNRFRRDLGRHVVAWLFCQAVMLAAGPATVWTGYADGGVECTCIHGDHAICPMHHKAPADRTRCSLQSADHSDTAMLSSMLGVAGLLPPSTIVTLDAPAHLMVLADVSPAPRRSVPPDPPPPRA